MQNNLAEHARKVPGETRAAPRPESEVNYARNTRGFLFVAGLKSMQTGAMSREK